MSKEERKEKERKREREEEIPPATAPWCQSFSGAPGALVNFTGVPGDGTINQSGSYWPFCGANNTTLSPPITFLNNRVVYIKSNAPAGSYPFVPNPCGPTGTTKNVTVT